ncbi:MAG TPA: APC family permease [Gemmatimonadaceae bacterium]|nr:APC family permease [Gemmatimonadaceae bacterium]
MRPTRLKRLLFGRPLPSDRLEHERLNKKTALAVLSSDAISSVAYATEQILLVLAVLGTAALGYLVPISAVIVGLLLLVAISYRQTIFAYPGGGGSYTVAKDNLGTAAGLVAAAALLTDYILTVAVSISGGVAAIDSAYPALAPHAVLLCNAAILVLMLVNLRGVRESGAAFSVPTYAFIALMVLMIGTGLVRAYTAGHGAAPVVAGPPLRVDPASAARHGAVAPVGFALTFLILRGFAEGCVAMTGTEAISNGVSAFKSPSPRNAAVTLGWMAAILAAFFLGTSVLARHYGIMPTANETVLSQLNRHVFGTGALYYALQYATFAVLVLAANTAFADFPRLSSILANDRYMPRQFAARGDRLAFSNGIIVLALVAMLLVWLFGGDTSALIPLYAIGVFVCFSLSQAGMVRHWFDTRGDDGARLDGWRWKASLNGLGAAATAVVAVIQVATKFMHGAWIVVLIIPLIIWMLTSIHRHYETFAREIAFTGQSPLMFLHHTVLVPVGAITKAASAALVYATAISEDVRAVYIEVDPSATARMRAQWDAWDIGVDLVVLPSPYRSVLRPLVDYVNRIQRAGTTDLITVVVPEVVPHRWWEHLLHNKTALYIRTAFLFRANVVVTSVPFLLGRAGRLRDLFDHDERLDERRSVRTTRRPTAAAGRTDAAVAASVDAP